MLMGEQREQQHAVLTMPSSFTACDLFGRYSEMKWEIVNLADKRVGLTQAASRATLQMIKLWGGNTYIVCVSVTSSCSFNRGSTFL